MQRRTALAEGFGGLFEVPGKLRLSDSDAFAVAMGATIDGDTPASPPGDSARALVTGSRSGNHHAARRQGNRLGELRPAEQVVPIAAADIFPTGSPTPRSQPV